MQSIEVGVFDGLSQNDTLCHVISCDVMWNWVALMWCHTMCDLCILHFAITTFLNPKPFCIAGHLTLRITRGRLKLFNLKALWLHGNPPYPSSTNFISTSLSKVQVDPYHTLHACVLMANTVCVLMSYTVCVRWIFSSLCKQTREDERHNLVSYKNNFSLFKKNTSISPWKLPSFQPSSSLWLLATKHYMDHHSLTRHYFHNKCKTVYNSCHQYRASCHKRDY